MTCLRPLRPDDFAIPTHLVETSVVAFKITNTAGLPDGYVHVRVGNEIVRLGVLVGFSAGKIMCVGDYVEIASDGRHVHRPKADFERIARPIAHVSEPDASRGPLKPSGLARVFRRDGSVEDIPASDRPV